MPGNNSKLYVGSVRLGTNTRLVELSSVTDPSTCLIDVQGAYNSNNFSNISDYRTYVRAGYQINMNAPLCGNGIAGREWTFTNEKQIDITGLSDVSGDITGTVENEFPKTGHKLLSTNLTFQVTCQPEFTLSGSSYSRYE